MMPTGTVGWGRFITGDPFQDWDLGSQPPSRPNQDPTNPRRRQIPKGGVARCLGSWHLLQEPRGSPESQNQAQEDLTWDLEMGTTLKMKPEEWGAGHRDFPQPGFPLRGGSGELLANGDWRDSRPGKDPDVGAFKSPGNPQGQLREALATKPELKTHAQSLGVTESFSRIFGNQHRLCHLWCELSTPTVPKPQPSCYPWAGQMRANGPRGRGRLEQLPK